MKRLILGTCALLVSSVAFADSGSSCFSRVYDAAGFEYERTRSENDQQVMAMLVGVTPSDTGFNLRYDVYVNARGGFGGSAFHSCDKTDEVFHYKCTDVSAGSQNDYVGELVYDGGSKLIMNATPEMVIWDAIVETDRTIESSDPIGDISPDGEIVPTTYIVYKTDVEACSAWN